MEVTGTMGMYIQDDYWEAAQNLTERQRGEFFNAIATYHFTGEVPKLTGIVAACFALCKDRIDAAKRSAANGRKGGRPAKPKQNPEPNPEPNPEETHGFSETTETYNPDQNPDQNPDVTQTEPTLLKSKSKSKEKDPKGSKEKKSPRVSPNRFVPPTLEEVEAYVAEKGYHFSPAAFIAHYESNGWMVGRNRMKSWKSACATWEHNNFGGGSSKQQVGGGRFDFDAYAG